MTAIIITPATTNSSTTTGLTAGAGLSFGVGLILGFSGFTGIFFAGNGAVVPTTRQTIHDTAVLAGAGNLSALLYGPYLTNPVAFSGAGVLSYPGAVARVALAALPGAGSLTANAVKIIGASFSGAGGLSAATVWRGLSSATFSGSGSLSETATLALRALSTFAGAPALVADAIYNPH